jgi:hypothetical protein
MAATNKIQLSDDVWTLIASSGSGFITNESIYKIIFCEAASLPNAASLDGHTIAGDVGAHISYNLTAGFNVYARSVGGAGSISLTGN